ncbi:MAG: autotransporter outer membrane beta-barrel domain-containing protein [Candidatus Omnitrophota bacterium]
MVKKMVVAGVLCFTLLAAVRSFAEPPQVNAWELGIGVSGFTYDEPGLMKEEGVLVGLKASYAHRRKLMLKAEAEIGFGTVSYDGSTWGGDPVTADGGDYKWELRGLVGYDFVKGTVLLTPYTGIAYRYLNDQLSGVGAYERESNYYYSPIGLEINKEFANGWSWNTTLEYDIFWNGLQVSHLSDVDPGLNDIKNDQTDGYGYRISMKFQNKNGFGIEPYYRYWDIKQSDPAIVTYEGTPVGIGVEPKNNSREIGIMFSKKF